MSVHSKSRPIVCATPSSCVVGVNLEVWKEEEEKETNPGDKVSEEDLHRSVPAHVQEMVADVWSVERVSSAGKRLSQEMCDRPASHNRKLTGSTRTFRAQSSGHPRSSPAFTISSVGRP